jgi:diguanylate cyclase (GGDEF)-like protein
MHGHQAGDAVLVEIAQRMRRLCVTAVSVARLGGDEFAMLFETTDGGVLAADEIRAVATMVPLPFAHGDETLLSVGISIGTSTYPKDGSESFALLASADTRLYANKDTRKQDRHTAQG